MFEIKFTESSHVDLSYFNKYEQNIVIENIENQLLQGPLEETRNRKPLRPNDLSKWELRIGKYRVFYDVNIESKSIKIKAIGWKEHNKLFIRGKEYNL